MKKLRRNQIYNKPQYLKHKFHYEFSLLLWLYNFAGSLTVCIIVGPIHFQCFFWRWKMGSCCCKGEDDFDPTTKGPVKSRSCTDILCCLLFFVFICGYVVVAIFAWLNGDPMILIHPSDSQGNLCGILNANVDLSAKPSVFYFDVTECSTSSTVQGQCLTTQICVAKCPTTEWSYVPDLLRSETTVDWSKYICIYGYNPEDEIAKSMANNKAFPLALKEMIDAKKCAPYYVRSEPVAGRCVPSLVQDSASSFLTGIKSSDGGSDVSYDSLQSGSGGILEFLELQTIAEDILADLTNSWHWILIAIGIAVVFCFIWVLLLRFFAGILIWGTIFAVIVLLGFGVVFSYNKWQSLASSSTNTTSSSISLDISKTLSTYAQNQNTWLGIFVVLTATFIILLLMILFLRKRIEIGIAIIKESTKAVMSMLSTLFYPVVTIVLCALTIAFWLSTALFLASTGQPVTKLYTTATKEIGGSCNISATPAAGTQCVFIGYSGDSVFHQNTTWLQVASAFALLWILNWVLALGECTLAGAFSSYYWAFDKSKDIPTFPLLGGFARSIRYHTGSLAFGALIIAIIQAMRMALEYAEKKLKVADNKIAKCLFCCLKCCFYCAEKIMKFINRNAYIMIAIYGKNFCVSAKHAFKLILRNILRVVVLDNITDFVFFIGTLVVTVGMGALSWAFLSKQISVANDQVPELNYYWFTIFVIALAAYITASSFFGTCKMAVDTIFLCFLVDLEKHDGSEENPYFMSKNLMKILGKKNNKKKKKMDDD